MTAAPPSPTGKEVSKCSAKNPLAVLRCLLRGMKAPVFDYLPRFAGGAIGYFGYDMVRYAERLPACPPDDTGYPDM